MMAETQAQKAKRIAAENALRIKNERQKEAKKKDSAPRDAALRRHA